MFVVVQLSPTTVTQTLLAVAVVVDVVPTMKKRGTAADRRDVHFNTAADARRRRDERKFSGACGDDTVAVRQQQQQRRVGGHQRPGIDPRCGGDDFVKRARELI